MTEDRLNRLIEGAAPIGDEAVANLDLEPGESELIEQITATAALDDVSGRGGRSAGRFLSRGRIAGAVIGACAAAAVTLIGIGSFGGSERPAFAAEAIRVAEANPRLLVTEPGWRVTRADEFDPDTGEMSFSNGRGELQITWYPASQYESYFRDRSHVDKSPTTVELLGQTARTVSYSDHDFATMLPPDGPTFVEIRGSLSREEYNRVLASLRPTDVETWLAALPADVVQPTDRAGVVDEMAADIPLPPGFDLDELRSEEAVLDRYHLGARVTGAISCEWLDRWLSATKAGDAETAAKSVEAMSTSRDWDILREMAEQGAWSQVVWEYSRDVAEGELNLEPSGTMTEGDKKWTFGPGYASGLGCDSEYRRRVPNE